MVLRLLVCFRQRDMISFFLVSWACCYDHSGWSQILVKLLFSTANGYAADILFLFWRQFLSFVLLSSGGFMALIRIQRSYVEVRHLVRYPIGVTCSI